jgi:dolichol-phosphate mannosyltransferase
VIVRVARFGMVGASGSVLNLSLFWLLTSLLHAHHLFGGLVAFEVALVSNYLLNQRWTFADRATARGGLLRYQITALGGLAISLTVLNLGVSFAVPTLLANAIGIASAMSWNFALSLGWTWRVTASTQSPAY